MIAFTSYMGVKAISVQKKKNLYHPPTSSTVSPWLHCTSRVTVAIGVLLCPEDTAGTGSRAQSKMAGTISEQQPASALLPSGRLYKWAGREVV
ncbi:unnamed protein product, partial [Staurois parvus]